MVSDQGMVQDPSPLIGEGVGDALGMPFETKKSDDPELLAWDGRYLPSEFHQLNPGQWTDDTMMAKLITESLFLCGGFYPRDIADRYRHWLINGAKRGMGKTTQAALENLDRGVPWCKSGIDGSEGNGTAMRSAPIGAFYHEDLYTTAEFARIDARITHRSREAEEGSAAVSVAVALLLNGVKVEDLVTKTIGYLEDSKIKDRLQRLVFYQNSGDVDAPEAMKLFGTSAHVVQTVPSAFSAFVFTKTYEEAVQAAVRAGGDTDTTAAITGALAGTYYGFSAIPKRYRDSLEGIDHFKRLESKIQVGPRAPVLWNL